MVNFYRPTYASAEDLFRTPGEERPFVDLSMTHEPWTLPLKLRKLNTGITRWGNLVVGLAVDGAIRRGVQPAQIRRAFDVGEVVARATATFTPEAFEAMDATPLGTDNMGTGFTGSVEIHGPELIVSGGAIDSVPEAVVFFERRGDMYVPQAATYGNAEGLESTSVDLTQLLEHGQGQVHPPRRTPEQFVPADRLGELEELVTSSLDMLVLVGDFPELHA